MPLIKLADVKLPEFGVPDVRPELSPAIYSERLDRFRKRAADVGIDVAIVYADREHFANIAYLTGFEPRFEEALLILAPGKTPVVVTGPENQGYAPVSPIELDAHALPALRPPRPGPDEDAAARRPARRRRHRPRQGRRHRRVEVSSARTRRRRRTRGSSASFVVDTLRAPRRRRPAASSTRRASSWMRATGLRAINEIDQLAQFEFAACHASEAVKRVLFGVKPGMREFDAARLMRPIGLPLSCHPMLTSGERSRLGLASPSSKPIVARRSLHHRVRHLGRAHLPRRIPRRTTPASCLPRSATTSTGWPRLISPAPPNGTRRSASA